METRDEERGLDRPYESHDAFYADVYSQTLRDRRPAGRVGAVLLCVEQGPGDWSDAPTPDLVITTVMSSRARGRLDLGASAFGVDARAGMTMLAPPGVGTSIHIDDPHDLRVLAIPYRRLLDLAGDDSALPPDGDFRRLHVGMFQDDAVLRHLDRLWSLGRDAERHAGLIGDGVILELAGALLRLRDGAGPAVHKGGLGPRVMRLVEDYLAVNLARDVALAELARVANLSASHFCRAYKQSTGRTPGQALIERRVARAKELLKTTDVPIIEVSAACGYDSPSAFAAVFRRATGMTPRGWRKEARR